MNSAHGFSEGGEVPQDKPKENKIVGFCVFCDTAFPADYNHTCKEKEDYDNKLLSSLRDTLKKKEKSIAELHNWIKSDSVYTILRYGSKSPSSSGVDDCEDSYYADLYNLSAELRKNDREKNSLT